MTESKYSKMFPPKVLVGNASPEIFTEIQKYLSSIKEISFEQQLNNFWIAAQKIHGTPSDFRCLGYCLPGLSYEQRKGMQLIEEIKIDCYVFGGLIQLVTNEFGELNWLYVKRIPKMYDDIERFLK